MYFPVSPGAIAVVLVSLWGWEGGLVIVLVFGPPAFFKMAVC